jgi:hypothetical protein
MHTLAAMASTELLANHLGASARLRALAGLPAPLDGSGRAQLAGLLDTLLRGTPRERIEARRICRHCAHSICRGPACPVGASVTPC